MTTRSKNEVTLIYTGVVTLAPSLPSSAGSSDVEADGPLYAVMPKTSARTTPLIQGDDATANAHRPVIFTKLAGTGRGRDDYHGLYSIWYIDRQRIEFKTEGNGKLLYKHGAGASKTEVDDIDKVAHLRDVTKSCVLRKDAISDRSTIVAAQVIVPDGSLRSGSHRWKDKVKGIDVNFRAVSNPGTGKPGTIMPQLRAAIQVADEVIANSTSLDTGKPLDGLSFDSTNGGEIWIGNLDVNSVKALIDEIEKGKKFDQRGQCDADFIFHYDVVGGGGEELIPCAPSRGGERKCYVAMAELPVER